MHILCGDISFGAFAQVPRSMVILEFMSHQRPVHAAYESAPRYRSPHPRFVFQVMSLEARGNPHAAAVASATPYAF